MPTSYVATALSPSMLPTGRTTTLETRFVSTRDIPPQSVCCIPDPIRRAWIKAAIGRRSMVEGDRVKLEPGDVLFVVQLFWWGTDRKVRTDTPPTDERLLQTEAQVLRVEVKDAHGE